MVLNQEQSIMSGNNRTTKTDWYGTNLFDLLIRTKATLQEAFTAVYKHYWCKFKSLKQQKKTNSVSPCIKRSVNHCIPGPNLLNLVGFRWKNLHIRPFSASQNLLPTCLSISWLLWISFFSSFLWSDNAMLLEHRLGAMEFTFKITISARS